MLGAPRVPQFPYAKPSSWFAKGHVHTRCWSHIQGELDHFCSRGESFLIYFFFFFFSVILDFFFSLVTEESLISFEFSSFCCIFVGLTRRRGDVQLSLSHPLVGKTGLSSAFFPVLLSPQEGRIAPLFLLFFFSIY